MSSDDKTFPLTLPGGQLMPFMSSRRRHEICDTVFEMLGGVERLHHEANRDQESYWRFMGLWQKGLPKAHSTEHSVNADSVEKLLERLDRAENATDITDASYTVTEDR
jgi:hypothetical protein